MSAGFVNVMLAGMLLSTPPGWNELTPFGTPFTKVGGFQKISENHGVTVFKDGTSALIRLAAEMTMNAPPDAVHRAVLDYERQIGVVARVSEIRIMERGPSHIVVYQRLNLPVIDDRDYVLMVTWGTAGETRWVKYWAIDGKGPGERDGVVRVGRHDGSWQIRPAAGGNASIVRFQDSMDLGGFLPMWMAKAAAGKEVPLVFADLCKMLAPDRSTKGEALCLR